MRRIRFHGRGGQGMKTASRILGSAAFHAGFIVQDSPVYGAERRGAPMAAFTRIAHEPIRDRGVVVQPDLVVVADDSLLTDLAAQPLAGCDASCTLLINSTKDEATLRQTGLSYPGRLLAADFTALALDATQTLASLSTALGVAAAHLVGLTLLLSAATSPWREEQRFWAARSTATFATSSIWRRRTPWQSTRRSLRNLPPASRRYGLVEPFQLDDADYVLVMSNAFATKGKAAVQRWRARGVKAGLLRLRVLRPFPAAAIATALAGRKAVAVIDQNLAAGLGGITYQEIATALYDRKDRPPLLSVIGGLGGKDISEPEFDAVLHDLEQAATGERVVSRRLLYTRSEQERLHTLPGLSRNAYTPC